MHRYQPKKIEPKWQAYWEKQKIYQAEDFSKKPKFYCLIEFPFPSGAGLHVGHLRSYTGIDAIARFKRMNGFNVLYPIGWDAFGLPTENYAIKTGKHPKQVTKENTNNFKRQIKSVGLSFDWSREINTSDPNYYKWTQWIFLKFFKAGLAYQAEMPINWCPQCKIGLANEEAIGGKCERCGAQTTKKKQKQWMLKITAYADRLLKDLDQVDYLDKIKTQQKNWIGKSKGAEIIFKLKNTSEQIKVFTTRPDTLFGATYIVVCPEHEIISNFKSQISNIKEVENYIKKSAKKSDLQRTDLAKKKTGVELKGLKAINPVNKQEIPIWVGDYILPYYGTGAIMAVPGHDSRDFEFARKYNLPIKKVISGNKKNNQAYEGEGKLINSDKFTGMFSQKAREKIVKWLVENNLGEKSINYKLRDWIFSRQHYWGEPIPLIHCDKCGVVPVNEKDLPVKLPQVKKYKPANTGESPLAKIKDWVNVKCPKCGGSAQRETDTMPNWAGSSWYFLRYVDPGNNKTFASKDKLKYWMQVDLYNGGMEHTTLHLLYSRFWHKFLYDQGFVFHSEPYAKRTSHGIILAEDGQKMSKSRGNVINPDDVIKNHGADSLRLFEMFMGPFSEDIPWSTKGLIGMKRFLKKVWHLEINNNKNSKLNTLLHQTIKKVTKDLQTMKFNTAIASLMEFVNQAQKQQPVSKQIYSKFLVLLAPFAPHITEELWQEKLDNKKSIHLQSWPKYNREKIKQEKLSIIVQINGKLRGKIITVPGQAKESIIALAKKQCNVNKYLKENNIRKTIFIKDKLINFVI